MCTLCYIIISSNLGVNVEEVKLYGVKFSDKNIWSAFIKPALVPLLISIVVIAFGKYFICRWKDTAFCHVCV